MALSAAGLDNDHHAKRNGATRATSAAGGQHTRATPVVVGELLREQLAHQAIALARIDPAMRSAFFLVWSKGETLTCAVEVPPFFRLKAFNMYEVLSTKTQV
jgi:hypothetical protein